MKIVLLFILFMIFPFVPNTYETYILKVHAYVVEQVTANVKISHILHLSSVKSIRKCKKKSLYNQPKPYFFQKNIMKSFLDKF
jgi:hypothetical protein